LPRTATQARRIALIVAIAFSFVSFWFDDHFNIAAADGRSLRRARVSMSSGVTVYC